MRVCWTAWGCGLRTVYTESRWRRINTHNCLVVFPAAGLLLSSDIGNMTTDSLLVSTNLWFFYQHCCYNPCINYERIFINLSGEHCFKNTMSFLQINALKHYLVVGSWYKTWCWIRTILVLSWTLNCKCNVFVRNPNIITCFYLKCSNYCLGFA